MAPQPSTQLHFALVPGTRLSELNGSLGVESSAGRLPLPLMSRETAEVLRRLNETTQEVASNALNPSQPAPWGELEGILRVLAQNRLLRIAVLRHGQPLATLDPCSTSYEMRLEPVREDARYRLSRFCYIRRDDQGFLLESPLAHARVRLFEHVALDLLYELSEPRAPAELSRNLPQLALQEVRDLLALLVSGGFASECNEEGVPQSDNTQALTQWCFHDLLFHSRSRAGRHDNALGGTYRFAGKIPPRPAVKPPMSQRRVMLFRPDLEWLMKHDLPLTLTIEQRTSVRQNGQVPLTVQQLGEFLYRVGRVRKLIVHDGVELTSRPYPNGGASYEFEIYLNVDRCIGLPRGLYHYDPVEHALDMISEPTVHTDQQLLAAWGYTGHLCRPQMLLTLAARFQRVSWKYESIAYATTLKNVGALYQTMYLVATAMGLGPCALGGGNSDAFSRMISEDYYTESSVGEFILGSRP